MGTRLKGQDTFIDIIADGKPDGNLGPWKSFEVTLLMEVLEEEFVGETTKQYDEIFDGCEFNMEGNILAQQYFRFVDKVVRRARYQTGGLVTCDIQTTFVFNSGYVLPYKLKDVKFGNIPVNVSSRRDFVTTTLTGKCSNQPTIPKI